MARIGLFGGSFNPVHCAHLILAERVREEAALDKVLFVPVRVPPHKPDLTLAPARDRLRMLQLALAGNPHLEPSTVELERDGPSYTLITVRQLKQQLGSGCQLLLVVGTDSIRDMPHWWHAQELAREVGVIGLERPGFPLDDVSELQACFGAELVRKIKDSIVSAPLLDISATDIRERVRTRRSIRYLVPEAVRQYILSRGLYAGA